MTDPLSVTAGVAGLVAFALEGVRLLVKDVNNIREAPKSLEDLQVDLTFVGFSLESLEKIDESQLRSLGDHVYSQSTIAIERCKSTCFDFRDDLRRWTKRSRDGKLSWRDKMNIGIVKERRIEAMSRQLQNCKLTLNQVAVTATLYTTIRSMTATEDIKKMLAKGEAETSSMIATVDRQIDVAEGSLAQFHQFEDGQSSEQDDEDLESARWAIDEEVAMLRASQEIMRSIIASMQAKLAECAVDRASPVATSVSFGANNHGFQVGTASGAISGISFGRN